MTRPASTRGLVYTTSTFSESTIAGKATCFIPKSQNRSKQQDRDELRLGDISPVDRQVCTGDEACLLGCQVANEAGDFHHISHPFQRDERFYHLSIRRTHISGRGARLNVIDGYGARR